MMKLLTVAQSRSQPSLKRVDRRVVLAIPALLIPLSSHQQALAGQLRNLPLNQPFSPTPGPTSEDMNQVANNPYGGSRDPPKIVPDEDFKRLYQDAIRERDQVLDSSIDYGKRFPYEVASSLTFADRKKRVSDIAASLEMVPQFIEKKQFMQAESVLMGRAGSLRYDLDRLAAQLPSVEGKKRLLRLEDDAMEDLEAAATFIRQKKYDKARSRALEGLGHLKDALSVVG